MNFFSQLVSVAAACCEKPRKVGAVSAACKTRVKTIREAINERMTYVTESVRRITLDR